MLDFIRNTTGDYIIRNGQRVIGNSDQQNINDLIYTQKGEYKAQPQAGAGAGSFLNSPLDLQTKKTIIKSNLELDGFNVTDVSITNVTEGIKIDPYATR